MFSVNEILCILLFWDCLANILATSEIFLHMWTKIQIQCLDSCLWIYSQEVNGWCWQNTATLHESNYSYSEDICNYSCSKTNRVFGCNQSCHGQVYAGINMKWMITVSLCVLKPVNFIYFHFLSQFPLHWLYTFCLFSLMRIWLLSPFWSWGLWSSPCLPLINLRNPAEQ